MRRRSFIGILAGLAVAAVVDLTEAPELVPDEIIVDSGAVWDAADVTWDSISVGQVVFFDGEKWVEIETPITMIGAPPLT